MSEIKTHTQIQEIFWKWDFHDSTLQIILELRIWNDGNVTKFLLLKSSYSVTITCPSEYE